MIKKKMKAPYKGFEETFQDLLELSKKKRVSIEVLVKTLSGKSKVLLLIFISLGFTQIPGIALFLGLFIAYLGLRIAIGRSFVWMPKWVLRKKIPSFFLTKVIAQILRLLKFIKRWSYPRYLWATQTTPIRTLNGVMIALVGVALSMCPPVPLVSFLASIAIFLIAIGLLNDDGVYILLGYVTAIVYFIIVIFLLKFCSTVQMIEWTKHGISYLVH